MTESMSAQRTVTYIGVMAGLIGVLIWVPKAEAKSPSAQASTVSKADVCDYHSQPAISTVTPNRVKPGQKITISGKNFGSKKCLHGVSFGSKSTNEYTYVSQTTLEATVPDLRPGSIPVTVNTEAGTSQF